MAVSKAFLSGRVDRYLQDAADKAGGRAGRSDFQKIVTDKLIEELKKGTAPWQCPWETAGITALPHNPVSGTRYKGSNLLWLMSQNRPDPRWMTFKQAASLGARVKKGARGTLIQYWKFGEEILKLDEKGNPVLDENGKKVKITVPYAKPRIFNAYVFNAEQIEGLPPPARAAGTGEKHWEDVARAEAILEASGARIITGADDAYYSPSKDEIHLPDKARFAKPELFYSTALHELGHWTGHPKRLNRDLSGGFHSESYAREELRAEIASMIISHDLRLEYDTSQHASYVKSWLDVLEKDPRAIFTAAADAEKIHQYVMAFEKTKEKSSASPEKGGKRAAMALPDPDRSAILAQLSREMAGFTGEMRAEAFKSVLQSIEREKERNKAAQPAKGWRKVAGKEIER